MVGVILSLSVVMNRPVWHLISYMNVVGGSTGHHRVRLIDAAVREFPNWALLGTQSTAHWGWGLSDITNQFILEGVRGGAGSLIAMIVVLVLGFRYLGQAMRLLRSQPSQPGRAGRRAAEMLCWAVGAGLFVHCVNFFGVSYFGQIQVFLMIALAMTAGLLRSAERSAETETERLPRAQRVRALLRPSTA